MTTKVLLQGFGIKKKNNIVCCLLIPGVAIFIVNTTLFNCRKLNK